VQATCTAALQIGDTAPSVHVVTRSARAAAVVQLALRTGAVAKPSDVPLSDRTQELLREMAGYWGFISVSADLCAQRHQGSAKAEKLAGLEMKRGPVIEVVGVGLVVLQHAMEPCTISRREINLRVAGSAGIVQLAGCDVNRCPSSSSSRCRSRAACDALTAARRGSNYPAAAVE
jgi:hypothetical protein